MSTILMKLKSCVKRLQRVPWLDHQNQMACALMTLVLWSQSRHVPWGLLCCETNHMCLEVCCAVKQITCALGTVVLWNKSHVPWGLLCCETNQKCLKGTCAVKQITCALRAVVLWNKDPLWVPDCQLAEQVSGSHFATMSSTYCVISKGHMLCPITS